MISQDNNFKVTQDGFEITGEFRNLKTRASDPSHQDCIVPPFLMVLDLSLLTWRCVKASIPCLKCKTLGMQGEDSLTPLGPSQTPQTRLRTVAPSPRAFQHWQTTPSPLRKILRLSSKKLEILPVPRACPNHLTRPKAFHTVQAHHHHYPALPLNRPPLVVPPRQMKFNPCDPFGASGVLLFLGPPARTRVGSRLFFVA
jgi:hypothetical protein